MNKTTEDFIVANWRLLLEPTAHTLALGRSPLRLPYRILAALETGPLTLQELSDGLEVHINTISTITRILEGKVFERSPITTGRNSSRTISLSVVAVEQLAAEPEQQGKLPVSEQRKFYARLPEQKFYQPIQSKRPDKWLFEDIEGRWLRIVSPDPAPWNKQWTIIFSHQEQKGDGSVWPYRLDLRLYPVEKERGSGPPAAIEREIVKGIFTWTEERPYLFYANSISEKFYLCYSIYPQA